MSNPLSDAVSEWYINLTDKEKVRILEKVIREFDIDDVLFEIYGDENKVMII